MTSRDTALTSVDDSGWSEGKLYIHVRWQWHNFIIPVYASGSCRRDAQLENVNIMQLLQPAIS